MERSLWTEELRLKSNLTPATESALKVIGKGELETIVLEGLKEGESWQRELLAQLPMGAPE